MESQCVCHIGCMQPILGLRVAIFIAVVGSSSFGCAATGEGDASRLPDELLSVIDDEDDGCLLQSTVLRPHTVTPTMIQPAPKAVALDGGAPDSVHRGPGGAPDSARRRRRSHGRSHRPHGTHRSHGGTVFTQISSDLSRKAHPTIYEDSDKEDLPGPGTSLVDSQILGCLGLVSLIIPVCLGSLMIWIFKQWFAKFGQLASIEESESISSEPEDQHEIPVTSVTSCEQTEASFSGMSFMVPLNHRVDILSPHIIRFDMRRHPEVQPIQVSISCIPDGDIWAKIELSLHVPGSRHIVPLISCSLVDRATSAEMVDITGVMQSWLALLLQEKSTCAQPKVDLHDQHFTAESDRSVNLQGVVEVLAHLGDHPLENHALEIRDGKHNLVGSLEPRPDGHFALMQCDRPLVEIEAGPQSRSLLFSRQGDVVALAQMSAPTADDNNHLHMDDSEDCLRMDVYASACEALERSSLGCAQPTLDVNRDEPEAVVLLICALAMVVFDLKL